MNAALKLSQFSKFVAVGLVNTFFGLAIIYSLMYFFELNPVFSNFSGYLLGFFIGYFLSKSWTFKLNSENGRGFFIYLAVVLFSFIVNIITVQLSIKIFSINPYIAQISGMFVYTITSFIGCKKIVFPEGGSSEF